MQVIITYGILYDQLYGAKPIKISDSAAIQKSYQLKHT